MDFDLCEPEVLVDLPIRANANRLASQAQRMKAFHDEKTLRYVYVWWCSSSYLENPCFFSYSISYSVRRTELVLGNSELFEYEYRFTEYEYD